LLSVMWVIMTFGKNNMNWTCGYMKGLKSFEN
jgi:hypothetical protein